jgi:hypothetical protein
MPVSLIPLALCRVAFPVQLGGTCRVGKGDTHAYGKTPSLNVYLVRSCRLGAGGVSPASSWVEGKAEAWSATCSTEQCDCDATQRLNAVKRDALGLSSLLLSR